MSEYDRHFENLDQARTHCIENFCNQCSRKDQEICNPQKQKNNSDIWICLEIRHKMCPKFSYLTVLNYPLAHCDIHNVSEKMCTHKQCPDLPKITWGKTFEAEEVEEDTAPVFMSNVPENLPDDLQKRAANDRDDVPF